MAKPVTSSTGAERCRAGALDNQHIGALERMHDSVSGLASHVSVTGQSTRWNVH